MKHLFALAVLCMLMVLPAAKTQDCSNYSNWDLRGTYPVGQRLYRRVKGIPNVRCARRYGPNVLGRRPYI